MGFEIGRSDGIRWEGKGGGGRLILTQNTSIVDKNVNGSESLDSGINNILAFGNGSRSGGGFPTS